jgi:glycyl-tRNA synthetase beta chain
MSDFLLELLSEEIPARMQAKARNDLARIFAEALDAAGLGHGAIETFSTPRRLALIARDVAGQTEAVSEEVKGPRTSAPAQALEGFLRKTGLSQDQLEDRDGVWFGRIDRPGRKASAVIAEAIATIIADFPWPKSMRWGSGELRWVRPLHSIIALLGEEIVPVAVGGIASGAMTLGHRFHHPGPITIGGAHDYAEKLRACHVIVDQDEREAIIREGAAAAAREAALELIEDEGLVVENAGLTEWPVPLLGRFDPDFLDVPREVIVLTMRTNQKYFACADADGALAPAFVCTANIDATDGGAAIVEGNRRVLAARLADARFFWEQDLKVPLEEQAKKLDGIVFHEKLGTVADKVDRVAKLARWLVEEGIVTPAKAGVQSNKGNLDSGLRRNDGKAKTLANFAERAARLAKADLVTGMVGEFPELQGVIGGYLAAAQGEPREVADAIRDHYKPVGQGDEVPILPVTVAVSLADKLDTLLSFFDIRQYPTGSKDPFALRRAALGIISLVLENRLVMQTDYPIEFWLGQSDTTKVLTNKDIARRSLLTVASEFLIDRLTVQQKVAGIRHDFIAASREWNSRGDVRLDRVVRRANALQSFINSDEGANLLAAYKRAANILKKEEGSWTPDQGRGDDLPAEELALVGALDAAEPKATAAIEAEDFTASMAALASLRAPIDAFFDKVTVNADDPGTRARRLALLARFRDAVNRVADFSKIEG